MKKDKYLPNPADSGFTVPKNYFGKAANKTRLLVKIQQTADDLPIQAPLSGMDVPNGYFEESKVRILSKIQRKNTPVIFLNKEFLRLAAIFVTVLGVGYLLKLNFTADTVSDTLPVTTSAYTNEFEYYLENEKNLSDFDWGQILTDTFMPSDLNANELSKQDMEDYLAENLNAFDFDEQQP